MAARVVNIKFDSADAKRAAAEAAKAFKSAIDDINRRVGGGSGSGGGGLGGAERAFRNISGSITSIGQSIRGAGVALSAFSVGIVGLGRAAVQSAVNIDRQINTLKALTGSAEAAERRYAQLVATAQKTPGLTANLAATLDAQLRVANVTVSTIDKILPAVGKLNAVSPLGDPQRFAGNLVQLVTQNFERADLKELVGQSPLAGDIIKQVFGVDNPTNAKAIRESAKRLGLTTTDAFFSAFAEAARTNPKLANVTDSLGTQFEKLRDRVIVALRPLGQQIINTLGPLVEKAVPIIESVSKAFAALPESARQAIVVLGIAATAVGPLVFAFGGLIGTLGKVAGFIGELVGGGLGAAGIAGGAGLSTLIPIIGAVVFAVGALGVAFATNFGGIRDVASDALGFVSEQFGKFQNVLKDNRAVIGQFKGAFKDFSDTVKPIVRDFWDFFRDAAQVALGEVLVFVDRSLKQLNLLIIAARQGASSLNNNLGLGPTDLLGAFLDPAGTIADFVTGKSSRRTRAQELSGQQREAAERANREAAGELEVETGIGSEQRRRIREQREATTTRIRELRTALNIPDNKVFSGGIDAELKNLEKLNAARNKNTIDSEKKKDSELRAIRQAQLAFDREIAQQSVKAEQDQIRDSLKNVEFEFDQKKLSLSEYYTIRESLQKRSVLAEIEGIQAELKAANLARGQTREGSAERLRADTEILRINGQLAEKQREIGQIEIENARDYRKALTDILTESVKLGIPTTANQIAIERQLPNLKKVNEASNTISQTANAEIKARREEVLKLQREEEKIRNQVEDGILTQVEGRQQILALERQIAEAETKRLEIERALAVDKEEKARIDIQIERLKNVGRDLRPAEAFFKGLRSETELLSEKLESLGRNFRDTFVDSFTELLVSGRNTFGNLFNVVKTAIARMSAELIASQLFRFFANGQTSGGAGGPVGGGSSSGGGGGLFQSILGIGSGGNLRTPPFVAAGATAGSGNLGLTGSVSDILGQIAQSRNSSSIPLSDITTADIGGLSNDTATARRAIEAGASPVRGTGFGSILGQFGGNLKNLFKGIGFGKAPGTAGGLAGALPLLGLTFGAGAGGSSILGQIAGGAGGALLGIGLSAAPAGLAGASPALAALFSNPITAIAGAGLLVGAIFLGRASQRRKDEEASGDFLQQAIDGIAQLREAVSTDQITGAQARAAFNSDILGTFRAQINTLKTKSVRESRLTNQVRDLQNLFESSVGPEITKQAERNRVGSRLTPEFAGGGMVGGIDRGFDSVNARLRPKEMVLTEAQQFSVAAMSGRGDIFQMAGVPKAPSFAPSGAQVFANGGTAQDGGDIVINFENVTLNVTEGEAERISIAGLTSNTGRRIQIDNVKQAKRDGQLA
jgi:hypothetical protein